MILKKLLKITFNYFSDADLIIFIIKVFFLQFFLNCSSFRQNKNFKLRFLKSFIKKKLKSAWKVKQNLYVGGQMAFSSQITKIPQF